MWTRWKQHFLNNAQRPLPVNAHAAIPAEVLRSLAVFQKGETGEGRIAHEIEHATLPGIDDDYRAALKLFVREEGRHARILGDILRLHGAALLRDTWTDRLFVVGRRMLGVRTKLLVLMAAEVIAVGFYALLAEQLPESSVTRALQQIAADEAHHLQFHAAFFRTQCATPARRALFLCAWWTVGSAACAVVLMDHRKTLHALGITVSSVARVLLGALKEAQVSSSASSDGSRSPSNFRSSRAAARDTSTA